MSFKTARELAKPGIRLILLAAAGVMLCSCLQMVGSKPQPMLDVSTAVSTCDSPLGSYFLPKSFVRIQVSKVAEENVLESISQLIRPDNRRAYCLSYLDSALGDDTVLVKMTPPPTATAGTSVGTNLLQLVASNGLDQSSVIFRRAVKLAFMGIANTRGRALKPEDLKNAERVGDFEFDPFNENELARINKQLTIYGFCVVLDDYTFERRPDSEGRRFTEDRYCRDPLGSTVVPSTFAKLYADYERRDVAAKNAGILYRPRTAYQLRIYAKDDPTGPGAWELRQTQSVLLENISPVLQVGASRGVFSANKVAFAFDAGSLIRVCRFRGSELLEAIMIPLEIVKSIVSLETDILKIQYDEITRTNEEIQAENNLALAQMKYLAVLQNSPPPTGGSTATYAAPPASVIQLGDIPQPQDAHVSLQSLDTWASHATCAP